MSFAIIFQGHTINNKILYNLKYLVEPIIKQTFDEASEHININLWNYIKTNAINLHYFKGFIQAIILTNSVAIYRLWKQRQGNTPRFMAGHSIGEYSALVCSKTIKFYDALKLVMYREKIMYLANNTNLGSMQVIFGLTKNKIQNIINKYNLRNKVNIACINLNHQIIIAGYNYEIEKLSLLCKKKGAKLIIKFPYKIASHCQIMKNYSQKLMVLLHEIKFHTPTCKIVNNVDVKCEKLKKNICCALIRQMYNTVRWEETITYIISKGIKLFLEIGSNNLYKGIRKHICSIPTISLNNLYNIHMARKVIKEL